MLKEKDIFSQDFGGSVITSVTAQQQLDPEHLDRVKTVQPWTNFNHKEDKEDVPPPVWWWRDMTQDKGKSCMQLEADEASGGLLFLEINNN